jgi:hypothetical protein
MRVSLLVLLYSSLSFSQTPCPDIGVFTPCEINFELSEEEAKAHPEPWKTVQLSAEVKSPRYRTILAEAFWDGGRKLQIRFTPADEGVWEYRLTSNIARFDKVTGKMNALPADVPGFIERANVHHWKQTGSGKAHLWMGTELRDLATAGEEALELIKASKATHVRTNFWPVWPPKPEEFRALETNIRKLNADNIIVDLALAGAQRPWSALGDWSVRERYVRYAMSRLAPYNVTWELTRDWETVKDVRTVLKDVAALVKKHDPYGHPRTAQGKASSSAFVADGWMTHLLVDGDRPSIAALEHQMYSLPLIALSQKADFKALWNATIAGAYPGFGATPTWREVMETTRYWELEPYFDVSNGRSLALEGTEYLVYVDRPGIVELEVEKHGYNVTWIDPKSGERQPQKKGYNGEHFVAEPPSKDHEWLLHLERDGRKEGMLKSYKFESRPILKQDFELDPKRIPFTVNIPDNADLKAGVPVPFEVKVTRDTRATRFMMYLITADVPTEAQGLRVLSTDEKGNLLFPASMATRFPAVMNLRVAGMNANGKAYFLDRVVRLVQ